jgi:hypothetical protein
MTENPVENPVCQACGAPLRPQALFCYNCGSAVAPEIEETAHDEAADDIFPGDEIVDKYKTQTLVKTDSDENHDAPIQKPTDTLVEDKPEKNSTAPTGAKLKSAAALRRSGRTAAQKKTVEVVWEEPESAPNVWFLVVAFVLALFAVGILLAMLYIR